MSARSLLIGLIMTVPALGLGPVFAFDPASPAPVNVEKSGVGLKGYDPVSYFVTGSPVEGDPTITAVHGGTLYAFASETNRDAFIVDPERYLPANGGFCAMAMSFGKKVDIDPNAWKIVDGTLYVQANPRATEVWQMDIPGNISKADENWPAVMNKPPNDL
jgi:YHS domain-containing protein